MMLAFKEFQPTFLCFEDFTIFAFFNFEVRVKHQLCIIICLFLSLVFNYPISAQNRTADNWYFGSYAGISFENEEPTVLLDNPGLAINSTASISDSLGNLLINMVGTRLYNKNHVLMENSSLIDVYVSNFSQTHLILPNPGDDDLYYLITIGESDRGKLMMNEIDFSDGIGIVTTKNSLVLDVGMSFKLGAVNHENGNDIWVMTQGLSDGKYYAFLITSEGIQEPVISDFGTVDIRWWDYGQLKFAPDGSKMIISNALKNDIRLYQFDNNNGTLSNEIVIDYESNPYGIGFSPNSYVLYVSSEDGQCSAQTNYIHQYDLSVWEHDHITGSKVDLEQSLTNYGFLQVASNGRVYISSRGDESNPCDPSPNLHEIRYPNILGEGCQFIKNSINLGGRSTYQGLPNFNQSIFYEPADLDMDGYSAEEDCDDQNDLINPGVSEQPYNGIDDDCNPLTPDDDLDGDGYLTANDCDDQNPNINPGQSEISYNGLDDDCNPETPDDDLDDDGYPLESDCNDTNPDINPSQTEIPYNNIDDDCDTSTPDDDLDGDGYTLSEDCDDQNPELNIAPEEFRSSIEICGSFDFGGETITTSGNYQNLFERDNCDSLVIIDVIIHNPVSVEILKTNVSLEANVTDSVSFQWFNCSDNLPVIGATENRFIPRESGSYFVQVSNQHCSASSECMDIEAITAPYPNPASSMLYVPNPIVTTTVEVIDLSGTVVMSQLNNGQLDVSDLPAGVYHVLLYEESGNKIAHYKIMIFRFQ